MGISLAYIREKRVSGNVHLSGFDNFSYVSFTKAGSYKLGVPSTLVQPTPSNEKGIY